MKIKRLTLDNFRSHNRLDLCFEDGVTVVVGGNGEGKTSILDAIAQLFGYFPKWLPGVSGICLKAADLRVAANGKPASGMRIWAQLDIADELSGLQTKQALPEVVEVSRFMRRDKSKMTESQFQQDRPAQGKTGMLAFQQWATALIDAENVDLPYQMPLVVYYGTSRAVFSTPLRRRNFKTAFARFDSWNGALDANTDFKRVFEWFHAKENEEIREQKRLRSFDYADPELAVVRRALETFFPSFSAPRTLLKPLRFVVDQQGDNGESVTLDLNQLSDGYRTSLAMVVDLACRMVEANPPASLADPLAANAIVLIDEVDLHLHPKWQQTILADLRRVFVNTQFIVTTHSPQVLTTVEARCIRNLCREAEHTRIEIPDFALGAKSGQLLEEVQHVKARPPLAITDKLNRYKMLLEQDQWDGPEALKLRQELDQWGAGKEPELVKMDVDIRMRAFRRGRN